MKKVNVGIIGLGIGEKLHIPKIKELSSLGVNLYAVCDTLSSRVENVCRKHNIRLGFTNYNEMLDRDDIDTVVIALPNHLHAPCAIDALKAGKHVLLEKPIAHTLEDGEKLIKEALLRKNQVSMLHMNYRFTPDSIQLKNYLDTLLTNGSQKIISAYTGWLREMRIPGGKRGFEDMGKDGWFLDEKLSGGGSLIDLGAHRIDLLLWLLNAFSDVRGVSGGFISQLSKFNLENYAEGTFYIGKDEHKKTPVRIETSWSLSPGTGVEVMKTTINAEKFTAIQKNIGDSEYVFESELRMFDSKGNLDVKHISPYYSPSVYGKLRNYTPQKHFILKILNKSRYQKLDCTLEQGLETLRIIKGLYCSARENHRYVAIEEMKHT